MTIKKTAWGVLLSLVSACSVAGSYVVKTNTTLLTVADKLGVPVTRLAKANHLDTKAKVKPGQTLDIPCAPTYGVIFAGPKDSDWLIARRYAINVAQLHSMNPNVNFRALKRGDAVRVPRVGFKGGGSVAIKPIVHNVVAAKSEPKAHSIAKVQSKPAYTTYVVRAEDNDWMIAKRVGITPHQLRSLNVGVDWNRLGPGKKLRVPNGAAASPVAPRKSAVASNYPRINSRHAVISKDNVVLRRGPGINAPVVAVVPKGTSVLVLDRDTHWYKLRFPKGTEAWVRADNLMATKAPVVAERERRRGEDRPSQRIAKRERESSPRVAHRESKAGKSQRIAAIRREAAQRVASYRRKGSREDYTKIAATIDSDSDVVNDAKKWLGTKYVYGAMSRGATDCSGFVGQVYRKRGVRLPRTSQEMASSGRGVPKSEMQKGDVIIFRNRGGNRVGHVGIYIGNNKFIHASSGKGHVTVSSLDDGYYNKRFVSARRVAEVKPKKKAEAPKAEKKQESKPTDEDGTDTPPSKN